MSLLATIIGTGLISFITLDLYFKIPDHRVLYKYLLLTTGLVNLLAISFLMYNESLQAGSELVPFSDFLNGHLIFSFLVVLTMAMILTIDLIKWGASLFSNKNDKE